MRNLLVCTDVTVRGGVDGYVLALLRALRDAGHHVGLLLEETTTSDLWAAAETIRDLPVRAAPLYHRRHDPATLRAAAIDLLDWLRPDGLHVVCGSPLSCLTLRDAAAARGLPTVVTEQQIPETLVLSSEQAARIRASYQAARHVVFVSQGNRATMADRVGLDAVRVEVIPNGVDVATVERRARAVRGPRQRPARLMTAARFAPEKGLDILVHAVALIPASLVGQVDIYGEGSLRDNLEDLVGATGMDRRVTLLPWFEDMPEQMARHDLFVLPSIAEGMPYVLLEAMAAGLPIVASDVPGSVEALGNGVAGTIVPRGDVRALATSIIDRLQDHDDTQRLVAEAQRRVRARYDVTLQMSRTMALWAVI